MSKKKGYAKGIWSLPLHEIDYSKEKVISYSKFSMFKHCPKKFELSTIKKLSKFEDNINTIFGTSMHNTIQNYLTVMYTKSKKSANEIDINSYLKNELKDVSKKYLDKCKEENLTPDLTPSELSEYYVDGISILNELRKKIAKFFDVKDELIATELPLVVKIDNIDNLYFIAYLDIVIYSPKTKKYLIIDLKASTRGWGEWQKKDKTKTSQLILYKKYLSKLHSIDEKDINVQYLILKRKINEDCMYPISRIQKFSPPNGSITVNKVLNEFNSFITDVFNKDGTYNLNQEFKAISHKNNFDNCKFCEFKEDLVNCPIQNRVKSYV